MAVEGNFPLHRGMAPMSSRLRLALRLDPLLTLGLVAIAGIGLIVLYSASGQSIELVRQQAVRLGIGLVVMLVAAQIPPRNLRLWTPWLYLAGLAMLVWVLFMGKTVGGSTRWIDLGFVSFQPSATMKVGVPMMVAWYLCDRTLPPSLGNVAVAGLLIAVPVFLVAREPDLGTALLIATSGAFVIFLAGLRWRSIAMFVLAAVALLPVGWQFLHEYQRQRILTFLNPESDPLGAGYQIIQSKIAVGSGGLYGKGWLNGTQSHLDFLPERSTDFIFAVYGEEFGFFGGVLLLALYLVLTIRGLYIAAMAQESYDRLLAGSLALICFTYAFVNIGMVIGLLPVVGVPLPLMSYGGSSMVTVLGAFGIIMSIHSHKRLLAP